MKKSFIALALGTFALGIAEFGMMGILGDVSAGLGVNIVEGGYFISAYSLGVAVGAPLLVLFHRSPLRRLLLGLAALIAVGNAFAALAPGFVPMLCARFIAGLPHGAFFGAGAIVCARLAASGHGAQAVAVMVGGMTVANLVGVPGATWISNALSWRWAFAVVALAGLLAFITIRTWVPVMAPLPDTGMKGQFRFLRSPAPWLIYAGVFFGQASVYCWFSYVEPIMTRVTGFPVSDMTWIMMVAGLGMVVGNAMSGRLADRFRVSTVCGSLAVAMAVVMPLIYFCAEMKAVSVVLMFLATAGLFGIGGPLQYLIVRFAKGGEMLGGAGIQIAFNVSNAMSAALGGAAIHHGFGLTSPALVGVPFAIIGATALFCLKKYDR